MAQNYIKEGEVFDFTLSGTVAAGSGILMGAIVGVALASGVSGDVIPVQVCGVFEVTKHGAGSGQAWAVGAALYWDASNSRFTTTASGNTLAGYAYEAALTAATKGKIKLLF
jgi:predicted RecA/RadA family phage recombinase